MHGFPEDSEVIEATQWCTIHAPFRWDGIPTPRWSAWWKWFEPYQELSNLWHASGLVGENWWLRFFFVSWRRTTKDNRKHKRRGFDIVSPIHWDGPRWTSQSCPRPSAFRAFRVWSKTGENWLPKMSPNANLFLGCFGGLLSVGLSWFYAPMKVMAGRLLRTDFPVVIDPVLEGAAKYYILGSQDSIWKRGWDESSLQPRKG